MNTHHSHSAHGSPPRMSDLGAYSAGSGCGVSAAEISAIVQAQLAYMQNTSGAAAIACPDGNQQAGDIYHASQENDRAPGIEDANQRGLDNPHAERMEGWVIPLIEAQKKLDEGDTRAAEALRARVMWMQEFNRLKDAGAPDDRTTEDGAAEKVTTFEKAQPDRHAQSYAQLVSARDGAADTARVANAAHEDRLSHATSISIEELRKDINRNHQDATLLLTRKNYSRK